MENPAQRLVDRFGGSRSATAAHFEVSTEAIRQWLEEGIPGARALAAEEATKGTKFAIKATDVLQFRRTKKAA